MGTLQDGFGTDISLTRRNVGSRILRIYGGNPDSASSTGAAFEGYLSRLGRRFWPLVGQEGYRALLEEAHKTILKDHPVLEKPPVVPGGNPYFGGLQVSLKDERPEEVWPALTELLGAFLSRAGALGRWAELSIWEEGETDGGPLRTGNSGMPSGPEGIRFPSGAEVHVDHTVDGEAGSRLHRTNPWKVAVIAPDRSSCEALVGALESARDFHVAGCGRSAGEVVGMIGMGRVDFMVVDAQLSSDEVLRAPSRLGGGAHGVRPLLVVMGFSGDLWAALRLIEAGAAGFIMGEFSVQALRLTLRLLARGEAVFPPQLQHLISLRLSELAELVQERGLSSDVLSELTARQGEVLLLLGQGMTNREIAGELFISEGTVKSHVHQILRKLRVRDRGEAVDVFRLSQAAPGESVLTSSGFRRKAPES